MAHHGQAENDEEDKIHSGNKPCQFWTEPNVSKTLSASIVRGMLLVARGDFIEFSRRESFKSYKDE
jgi:ABC-type Zn2+ transport system substrate-binding protein/surface adhesin